MKDKVEYIIRANWRLKKLKREVYEVLVQKVVDYISFLSIHDAGYLSETRSALADPPRINNAVVDQINELERQGVRLRVIMTLNDFAGVKSQVRATLRKKWGE